MRVGGTRISLDLIVYGFLEGHTAEQIAANYPSLRLRDVYGAITYYLENRDEVDAYLREEEAHAQETRREHESNPDYQDWRNRLLAGARERGLLK